MSNGIVYTEKDAQTGIETRVHSLDSGKVVIEKQYDAQPFVETAAEMRSATEGERWGEMRHVGFIPMAELATMMRQDGGVDRKRVMAFLQANPGLVTFSKAIKKG
jgi:hypothetical protein